MRSQPARVAFAVALLLMVAAPRPSGLSKASAPIDVISVPISPSVLGTFALRYGELGLLVLSRGQTGWYAVPPAQDGAGGSASGVDITVQRGTVNIGLQFDLDRFIGSFQGKAIKVPVDTNVIFVDSVDGSTPTIVRTLHVDSDGVNADPRFGSIVPLLRKSPELVAYLRCEPRRIEQKDKTERNSPVKGGFCDELTR